MRASESNPSPMFGFMSVVDLGATGLIGGYLILNVLGRPLEFHCTEPIRANRAQQILYGATLKPYLYGEQIGQALLKSGAVQPDVLFCDERSVLALREFCDRPVVWVGGDEVDRSLCFFSIANVGLSVDKCRTSDETIVVQKVESRNANWCLREPFQRIRDAVTELQKAA